MGVWLGAEGEDRPASSREHQFFVALAVMIFVNFALVACVATLWALLQK